MVCSGWKLRRVQFGVLVAIGVLAILGSGLRLGGRPARAQSPQDDSQLLQLAQRLLSPQFPGPTINGPSPSVQLFPGAITSDFPADVPLPYGSTVIGSDERSSYAAGPTFIGSVGAFVPAGNTPPGATGVL